MRTWLLSNTMRNSTILFLVVILTSISISTTVEGQEILPDHWTYYCGVGSGPDCPDTHENFHNTIANKTSQIIDNYLMSVPQKNDAAYILVGQPFHSDNERIDQYSFSLSPSGVTESYTEISDKSKTPIRTNTTPGCQDFLSGNFQGASPELLQSLHTSDILLEQRGELRAKDTLVREYPGVAKVCMVNSVYWDRQESDRKHDYFFVDSKVIIEPLSEKNPFSRVKNKEAAITFNVTQNTSETASLRNLWIMDFGPGTSPMGDLTNPSVVPNIVPWYEYYLGPFGSMVTLSSDNPEKYDWHIATGFFSRFADSPIGIDPYMEILVNETEARDALQHRLISMQFDGTRGWLSMSDGFNYVEYPKEKSSFGSDYTFVWVGMRDNESL